MLKTPILHPELLAGLAAAGHLSTVLISDGNYPHVQRSNPRARVVWANFAPGVVDAATMLRLVCDAVPIEAVAVMQPALDGPYALASDPPIWATYRSILRERSEFVGEFARFDKPEFNVAAMGPDLALVIATAETAIWANLLITIGVVRSAVR